MLVYTKTRKEAEVLVSQKLGDTVRKGKLEKSSLGWASLVRRQYWKGEKIVSQIVNVHDTKVRKQKGFEVWIADSLVS
jgi:lambda repressor-like predicted transcriptional regulator